MRFVEWEDASRPRRDYVIVGKSPGSKFKKAQMLNLEVLDETAFRELLITLGSHMADKE